ncbi:hypothetical protein AVL57_05555 [Alteromonas stellipolaris]|uniref:Uncharacterized protein n=1 Tax=Alteromonas stellipolaris TaxID=233316 RepID=A0ABN4LKU2_9ALTE|nr:hypothetical protein AVL57_05555 [Alteromonas stellipolaris]
MQDTKYQKKHKNSRYLKRFILNTCFISIFQTIPHISFEWHTSGSVGEFQFEQQVTFSVSKDKGE